MPETIIIPLDAELKATLQKEAAELNMKPEEVAQKALKNYFYFQKVNKLREELYPYAEKKGIKTEVDFFNFEEDVL